MPDVFELNSEFERIVDRIKIAERFCESYGLMFRKSSM